MINATGVDVVIFYHDKCLDGVTSLLFWDRVFPGAEQVGLSHGNLPESDVLVSMCEGKTVVLVDFSSIPRLTIDRMRDVASRFIFVDHHHTSVGAVGELCTDSLECAVNDFNSGKDVFYLDESTAASLLSWDLISNSNVSNPGEFPDWASNVADIDVWDWKLDSTGPVVTFLCDGEVSFDRWKTIEAMSAKDMEDVGRSGWDFKMGQVDQIIKTQAFRALFNTKDVSLGDNGWVECYCCATPSDLRHYVSAKLYDGEPFSLTFMVHDMDDVRFSISSSETNGWDVENIAKRYGGGGHTHASGFSIPMQDFIEVIKNVDCD